MQEATNNLFAIDSTTEVVRESVGKTCQWCLELCGIWHPYDANHYGVWARHAGCDCKIYVRNSLTWPQPSTTPTITKARRTSPQ